MTNLEQLFNTGLAVDTIELRGVQFTVSILGTKYLKSALNAFNASLEASAENPNVIEDLNQSIVYQLEMLSRALIAVNGVDNFVDSQNPTAEEIVKVRLEILERLPYSVLSAIFKFYTDLDDSLTNGVEEDIKKYQSKRGA